MPAVIGVALAGALLAGCSAPGGGSDAGEAGAPVAGADAADAAPEDIGGADGGARGEDAAGQGDDVARQLVTTGHATLVATDPFAAAEEVAQLTEDAGGRVESRDEAAGADGSQGSASLTLRVPADQVTDILSALEELGDVTDRRLETQDVTGSMQDLDARIDALATSVDRLTELLSDADTMSDLFEIESELTARQADLDALRAERDRLRDEVALSTLHLDIRTEGPPIEAEPAGFVGGLSAGWTGLVGSFNVLIVIVGALLPWAVVGGLGYLALRPLLRRQAARRSEKQAERARAIAQMPGHPGRPGHPGQQPPPMPGSGSPTGHHRP
ncbi:DUF4349 domain-containing protein [Myceligenerans pegani]|uniref:DUF4349 domain-containing protein n=1 Tax=Myceligenerans pegani TaxID=2776917 RepID=A0ABR9MU61_9MICO|nr:DUF4349 domain-containing protein [Myceligenerans sp. TRM 65318]MBE1874919.1 DUF4349 domain-containing protein [Myceligenerans sp. TRM 65318]MBE3017190.1 DUF4349 domain-containing protein [Myceligenerans sp. TRM 65318]